jgi:hypothetical protein
MCLPLGEDPVAGTYVLLVCHDLLLGPSQSSTLG